MRSIRRRRGNGGAALCGSSSVGRASAFQAEGREFESRLPLQCQSGQLAAQIDWIDPTQCLFSSGVEHFHGKEGVPGSIPGRGSYIMPESVSMGKRSSASSTLEGSVRLSSVYVGKLNGSLGSIIRDHPKTVEIYDIKRDTCR